MDPETVSPRPSVDLNLQNTNPIKDTSPDGKIFIPVVRKIGYLMRKTGFLKRWAQQFCVLDRFSLSCYDSETAMRSGNLPNDVIKLHGSSVYDGGLSQTHKSTRIHISTDDDHLHCFTSKDQKEISAWMVALYEANEHLSTIDFGPEGGPSGDRSVSFDEEDMLENVGIGSRSIRHRRIGAHKGRRRPVPLRRTVSQFVRDAGSSTPRGTTGFSNKDRHNHPSLSSSLSHHNHNHTHNGTTTTNGVIPQSPRRKTSDDQRWKSWTLESHECFRYVLDRTHWKRIHTHGTHTVYVGTLGGPTNSMKLPNGMQTKKHHQNTKNHNINRTVYKATCMVRAAPETIAQVITDTNTRGMWDAQFPIANVINKGGIRKRDNTIGASKDDIPIVLHLQSTTTWSSLEAEAMSLNMEQKDGTDSASPVPSMVAFAIGALLFSFVLPGYWLETSPATAAVIGASIVAALLSPPFSKCGRSCIRISTCGSGCGSGCGCGCSSAEDRNDRRPRDLCVVQCVRHHPSGNVSIAEHSCLSQRCPKAQGYVRADQRGCGFFIESVSMNGWPASQVTMISNYVHNGIGNQGSNGRDERDQSVEENTINRLRCFARLRNLESLSVAIAHTVESWSERVHGSSVRTLSGSNNEGKKDKESKTRWSHSKGKSVNVLNSTTHSSTSNSFTTAGTGSSAFSSTSMVQPSMTTPTIQNNKTLALSSSSMLTEQGLLGRNSPPLEDNVLNVNGIGGKTNGKNENNENISTERLSGLSNASFRVADHDEDVDEDGNTSSSSSTHVSSRYTKEKEYGRKRSYSSETTTTTVVARERVVTRDGRYFKAKESVHRVYGKHL